ncbi:type III pantothenate kinase [Agarilytica rhodophyticola]|uniref:type III pantothenate kinase n=1 Tax=Agarilytica rhodophyticola TaxID=1737490 RepID=UPI000B345C28|nr:type III pantothenate kinase [Agarilytica rhodophyticola]
MRLLLDAGNTRWKWAIEENSSLIDCGVINSANMLSLEQKIENLPTKTITSFAVSSVVAEKNISISRWGETYLGLSPSFAKVKKHYGGVTASYANIDNLGVDRWLAMLAAWQKVQSACLVVDAGSALTVDCIDHSGLHQGGLIVPGIAMMRRALFEKTSAVKVDAINIHHDWKLGCDTIPCVANGLSAMIKGFMAELTAKMEPDTKIFVTGGDAFSVKSFLPEHAQISEYLVLEGLMQTES